MVSFINRDNGGFTWLKRSGYAQSADTSMKGICPMISYAQSARLVPTCSSFRKTSPTNT